MVNGGGRGLMGWEADAPPSLLPDLLHWQQLVVQV